jgi:hypothetical protein
MASGLQKYERFANYNGKETKFQMYGTRSWSSENSSETYTSYTMTQGIFLIYETTLDVYLRLLFRVMKLKYTLF